MFKLKELIQQGESAISATSTLIGQGMIREIDCIGVEILTEEQLCQLFSGIPNNWDFVELAEVFDSNTLSDDLAWQLSKYCERLHGRTTPPSDTALDFQGEPAENKALDILNSALVYADLEISQQTKDIFQAGIILKDKRQIFERENLDCFYQELAFCREKELIICGHNFRRFDYPHLLRQNPQLQDWTVVDTLELSIVAFPLQQSHRLKKEYKQSKYTINNPLEDSFDTRFLLRNCIEKLLTQPLQVRQLYAWLLSCGNEEADRAYHHLFSSILNWWIERPSLDSLPAIMIEGLDFSYLKQIWSEPQAYDFDSRLCLAGLLAWNYESRRTESSASFARWLNYLPSFDKVLNNLCPLKTDESTLKSYLQCFGISSFRPQQKQIIDAVLASQNPLSILPTGGGKSLCYQLPALMLFDLHKALTVVVSPLQALMADQVADLENAGLTLATFVNGNLSALERHERLQQVQTGSKGLLYISPEQLRSVSIRELLKQRPPKLWVIDEAHCISQWGHDFRPDYQYIPKFIQELYIELQQPKPLLSLTTATATMAVCKDIKDLFAKYEFDIDCTVLGDTTRHNLVYETIPATEKKDHIIVSEVKKALELGGSVLIYTTTRKNSVYLAQLLNQNQINARYYHGKLSKAEKHEVLEAFKNKELDVVAATCAFGMGINRPDVRAVIHHSMSANLEGYIQEAGRAGRDGQPSKAILIYNPKDAETIFWLQSLNQLSELELRNIFISTRNLRDRIYKQASEEWFWLTTNDIFSEGDFNEEFGSDTEQRDTKIKVALHYLETFSLIERAENLSTYIKFELVYEKFEESWCQFKNYCQTKNLASYQMSQFENLVVAMHAANAYCGSKDEPFPLERLSDESGIEIKELTSRIRELQKAGVCSIEIPIRLQVTKGVRGDALKNYQRLRQLESEILETLREISAGESKVTINVRGLASQLDPDSSRKIRASIIADLIAGWANQKWIRLKRVSRDSIELSNIEVEEHLPIHQTLAASIVEIFHQTLDKQTGSRLPLKYDLEQLLSKVQVKTQLDVEAQQIESVLVWLHQRRIIRLTEGLNLFQQSLKVRVIKNANFLTVNRRYPDVKKCYDEQTKRTHIMVEYGKLSGSQERQLFINDYFKHQSEQFLKTYQLPASDIVRPTIPDEYKQITDCLNDTQKEIVMAEDSAIAVIAGPGSGKTRTIVHRIAYLVKVKRVDPQRILVLAYNRNAVGELRLRLQTLIGSLASRLRVYTFHSLALALLGRTFGENTSKAETAFEELLDRACDLFETGDEFEEESKDNQARRIELLGNLEHIFVDEYQDVGKSEYRLIQLIAGLGDSEDESRSVQINLCVIGDDDQNIYEFRGTDLRYILQFEAEYKARRFLLTENYRSSESIIEVANQLISSNQQRCKRTADEQIEIDARRKGESGKPVKVHKFNNPEMQAAWIRQQIESWLGQGVKPNQIAIIARKWDKLNPVRLLLEQINIPSYALKRDTITLVRNRVTCQLIDYLKENSNRVLSPQESVYDWFKNYFSGCDRNLEEPTVKALLKIASELDLERGFGSKEFSLSISVSEILTSLFEYNASGGVTVSEEAVLVTTCHSAKGLEFNKVILLGDDFSTNANEIESERRLFYVAMTRAAEELILCCTRVGRFILETNIEVRESNTFQTNLPERIFYKDLTPKNVHLGHYQTRNRQETIEKLYEEEELQLVINQYRNGWDIQTIWGETVGGLSRRANQELASKGLSPQNFRFLAGEVTVRNVYRHLQLDRVTDKVLEDWFVVIPQIRVCR